MIEVEYPYSEGFIVNLAYLTRDEILNIRKQSTKTKIPKGSRLPEEVFDDELFTELFVSAIIKGWKGLTFEILGEMFPIDTSEVVVGVTELPYTKEDALILMRNSTEFDSWISEVSTDVSAFMKDESK